MSKRITAQPVKPLTGVVCIWRSSANVWIAVAVCTPPGAMQLQLADTTRRFSAKRSSPLNGSTVAKPGMAPSEVTVDGAARVNVSDWPTPSPGHRQAVCGLPSTTLVGANVTGLPRESVESSAVQDASTPATTSGAAAIGAVSLPGGAVAEVSSVVSIAIVEATDVPSPATD